jgi:hypothetical protein
MVMMMMMMMMMVVVVVVVMMMMMMIHTNWPTNLPTRLWVQSSRGCAS